MTSLPAMPSLSVVYAEHVNTAEKLIDENEANGSDVKTPRPRGEHSGWANGAPGLSLSYLLSVSTRRYESFIIRGKR